MVDLQDRMFPSQVNRLYNIDLRRSSGGRLKKCCVFFIYIYNFEKEYWRIPCTNILCMHDFIVIDFAMDPLDRECLYDPEIDIYGVFFRIISIWQTAETTS